ncbi:hypothetical protein [Gordonia malaquae]|uniref:hypothetical protein n=1 Tax=Gordonia malaquae TaxID=410332 RepID=UPI003018C2E6
MKFGSLTDEYLYRLTLDGTFRDGGSNESPTGWFAAVVLPAGTAADTEILADIPGLTAAPTGWFLVTEDEQGFVGVQSFGSEAELDKAFAEREEQYAKWAQD